VQNGPDADSGAIFLAVSYEQPISQGHDIHLDGYNIGRDWLVGNATQFSWPIPNPLQFEPTPDEISSLSFASAASAASLASISSIAAISSVSLVSVTSVAANHTGSSVTPTPTPTPTPTTTQQQVQPTESLNSAGGTGDIAQVPNSQVVGRTSANNYTYETTAIYYTGLLGNTSNGVNHYQSVPEDGLEAIDGMVAVLTVKIVQRPDGKSSGLALSLPSTLALCIVTFLSTLAIFVP